MQPFTSADTRSPWYETFSPKQLPAVWVVNAQAKPPASPPPAPQLVEADFVTEAIFDCYNG